MLISTKGRYALRVMIDLAEHQNAGYIPVKEVAQRQGISEKYRDRYWTVLICAWNCNRWIFCIYRQKSQEKAVNRCGRESKEPEKCRRRGMREQSIASMGMYHRQMWIIIVVWEKRRKMSWNSCTIRWN